MAQPPPASNKEIYLNMSDTNPMLSSATSSFIRSLEICFEQRNVIWFLYASQNFPRRDQKVKRNFHTLISIEVNPCLGFFSDRFCGGKIIIRNFTLEYMLNTTAVEL